MSEEMEIVLRLSIANFFIIFFIISLIKKFIKVSPPNKVFVCSGTNGTRISLTGRSMKFPIIEKIDELDLSIHTVKIKIKSVYSKEGILVDLQGIAYVKISKNPNLMYHSIDRFLGENKNKIAKTAKETIESHIKELTSSLTLKEIYENRLAFSDKIILNTQDDISKLGLQIDVLKVYSIKEVL